jgi:hypothetical protein
MSEQQWACRAVRGEHSVQILTALRAFGKPSINVRGTSCKFLLRILADGEAEAFDVLCPNEQSVRTWLSDMEPHHVEFLVAEGEDADAVSAQIRGRTLH